MDGCLDMFDYAGKLCKEINAHYKPISTMYYFSGYFTTSSFDGIVEVRVQYSSTFHILFLFIAIHLHLKK